MDDSSIMSNPSVRTTKTAITSDGQKQSIMEAAKTGDLALVRSFIDRGANVNGVDKFLKTPLIFAAEGGHIEIVELLIDNKAVVNTMDKDKRTALHYAAQNGFFSVCVKLIEHNANINTEDVTKRSPLVAAALENRTLVAEFLIDKGANINFTDDENMCALHYSVRAGHVSVSELLVNKGTNLNLVDNDKWTPLHYASGKDLVSVATLMINKGSKVNAKDKLKRTPLHYASERGFLEMAEMLIKNGARVSLEEEFEEHVIPLTFSVLNRSSLNSGVELCLKTPLHLACQSGHLDMTELLVSHGADVNVMDEEIVPPLFYASKEGHAPVVEFLLAKGANINATDSNQRNALHYAAEKGHLAVAELLVFGDIDVNVLDINNKTPLHLSADMGHSAVATLLIANGAELSVDEDGNTILGVLLKKNPKTFRKILAAIKLNQFFAHDCAVWFSLIILDDLEDDIKTYFYDLVAKYPELVYCKNKDGVKAIDVASKELKKIFNDIVFFCGRYELRQGPPVYVSEHALLIAALDHGMENDYNAVFDACMDIYGKPEINEQGFVKAIQMLDLNVLVNDSISSLSSSSSSSSSSTLSEELSVAFQSTFTNKSVILKPEFVNYCIGKYGKSRNVAIKYLKNEERWYRERNARINHQLHHNGHNAILNLSPSMPTENEMTLEMVKLKKRQDSIFKPYDYAIVMPEADQNLKSIFITEQPNESTKMNLLQQIALAIYHLHTHNVMHGNIKMSNILRKQNTIRLTDFASSAPFDTGYAGVAYTSSGILPPELFIKLNDKQLHAYEEYVLKNDTALWNKVKPVQIHKFLYYAVKTFVRKVVHNPDSTITATDEPEQKGLPYELIPASALIDIWSFGLLVFQFMSSDQSPLFAVNQKDELVSSAAFAQAAAFTDDKLETEILTRIPNIKAQNLLRRLLAVDPQWRYQSMTDVLADPFFQSSKTTDVHITTTATNHSKNTSSTSTSVIISKESAQDTQDSTASFDFTNFTDNMRKKTDHLLDMTVLTYTQLKKVDSFFIRNVFDMSQVRTPTSFIILPHKLQKDPVTGELRRSMATPSNDDVVTTWVGYMNKIGTKLAQASLNPTAYIKFDVHSLIKKAITCNTMYVYYVDEFTGEPVVPETHVPGATYPLTVTEPVEFVKLYLPLLRDTYKLIASVNTLDTLVVSLGYPSASKLQSDAEAAVAALNAAVAASPTPTSAAVTSQNDEVIKNFKHYVGDWNKDSALAEYDLLRKYSLSSQQQQSHTDNNSSVYEDDYSLSSPKGSQSEATAESQLPRGSELKLLSHYFINQDPQGAFADMRRMVTAEGKVLWVSDETSKKILQGHEKDVVIPKEQTAIQIYDDIISARIKEQSVEVKLMNTVSAAMSTNNALIQKLIQSIEAQPTGTTITQQFNQLLEEKLEGQTLELLEGQQEIVRKIRKDSLMERQLTRSKSIMYKLFGDKTAANGLSGFIKRNSIVAGKNTLDESEEITGADTSNGGGGKGGDNRHAGGKNVSDKYLNDIQESRNQQQQGSAPSSTSAAVGKSPTKKVRLSVKMAQEEKGHTLDDSY